MTVGIDAQLARGTATGIGEYVAGLIDALRACAGIELAVLSDARLDPWRFDRRVLWDQVFLPRAARRAHVALLHCAAGTMPLASPAPVVVTIHDVAWLRVQGHARAYARAYFGAFQRARYPSARRILVDSNFSREELLASVALDPARIAVVYPGVGSDLFAVARNPDPAPFALVVGTVEPRKNLATAIRALRAAPDLRLVSVGPPTAYAGECLRLAREFGVAERVELRGYVPRDELLGLYARATFVAMPSRYEGFGYGAAQALCAGAPLLAADAASLPEVVGTMAPLLPPDDANAWSDAFNALLSDRAAAEAHAAAQRPAAIARFSWRASAEAVAAIYADALVNK